MDQVHKFKIVIYLRWNPPSKIWWYYNHFRASQGILSQLTWKYEYKILKKKILDTDLSLFCCTSRLTLSTFVHKIFSCKDTYPLGLYYLIDITWQPTWCGMQWYKYDWSQAQRHRFTLTYLMYVNNTRDALITMQIRKSCKLQWWHLHHIWSFEHLL